MRGSPRSPHLSSRRQPLVRRRRLLERLSGPRAADVVLLCALAGSGKTSLLRSWIEAEGLGDRVAWVSIDRGERDAQRFWLAVIDELSRTVGGDRFVEPVTPAPGFRGDTVVERLLAELDALEEPVVLVIDNLHELDSPDALQCLEPFLEHLPPQVRVALATRVEPRLGLHRRRVAGRLTELRSTDLAFSVEETRDFLEAAGVTLSDQAVAALHARTEGWAAGLRLASISLARHPDPERFVAEFSGSERNVAEYLLAEVLEQQTPDVRDLLLRTSVLDRVSGPLADVLTGRSGSEQILQSLDDANAFVVALDTGRTWFRYCNLLSDLLRLDLRRTAPTAIRSLHRTASEWFEQHGYVVEAIRHAQAARDWRHASDLLGEHNVDLILDGRLATMRALLAGFPADAHATEPELAIASAAGAISDGSFDDARVYIDHALRLVTAAPAERRRRFDLLLAGLRLWLASRRGDIEALPEAMRALEAALTPPTPRELPRDNDVHATALMHLGMAELWSARLDDARRHFERALALARRIRRPYVQVGCLGHLGLTAFYSGSPLSVVIEFADEAVSAAEAHGWGDHAVIGAALAARAIALAWLGRLDEAQWSLDRAQRTLAADGPPGLSFAVHSGQGLLHLAQGRPEQAMVAFIAARGKARLLAGEHALGDELRGRLVQTQVELGDTEAARGVLAGVDARSRDGTAMRVAEAVIDLAEGRPREALDVLAPALQPTAEPTRLGRPRIRAQLCDGVAREQLGDARAAEASLERALELAAPERIVLPFVLPPARELVMNHPLHRTAHPELLAVIQDVLAGSSHSRRQAGALDELSPAELRVLGYLPSDLTAGEIASELYLSANTVRTHLRHIYAKLGAHTRREAVARAREFGLLVAR
jgi:LuxR family transcriptional regulator, maltose regulon positive regulatory protein